MFPRTVARFAAIQAVAQQLFMVHIQQSPLTVQENLQTIMRDVLAHNIENDIYDLLDQTSERWQKIDTTFFKYLVTGIGETWQSLDIHISAALPTTWSLGKMEPVTHAIFRCACYEIMHPKDAPKSVIFNEYILAAHAFLLEKGPGFVNALLDKLYHRLAPVPASKEASKIEPSS